ncbi:hypothetical protein UFOVP815_48 [uncultured Caudovirales phage]|uniref:Uncharacterized protein n=1 Tax=uncultured Caudovirales phage TaxID=2100421 RepID=A0A6J5P2W8_9CAUD|nr:hypothetical protein UFOVP815_48 [uncultured Caudovirales phage]
MAKAKNETQNEVTIAGNNPVALSDDMFAADAGSGMEGATSESFAIPFLSVLQKGSPQVDEASGVAIDGAKAGMLWDNVAGRMFDGKEGVVIIPCAYRRVFLRWAPKGTQGSGFKGELSADQVAGMRAAGQIADLDGRLYVPLPDGTVHEKRCDRISDTRNHYVLLVDAASGAWVQALLSLTSTQIKKSKMLMSALASVKLNGAAGMYTPPTFANLVRLTTVPESNDKGTWFGTKFELAGRVDRSELYAAAKAFHASVAAGSIEVKYEAQAESAETADRGF